MKKLTMVAVLSIVAAFLLSLSIAGPVSAIGPIDLVDLENYMEQNEQDTETEESLQEYRMMLPKDELDKQELDDLLIEEGLGI